MRKALKQIKGERTTFTGTFIRFGLKNEYMGVNRIEAPLQIDYCLSFPTKVEIVKRNNLERSKEVINNGSTSNRS